MVNWRIRPIVRGEILGEKSELLAFQDAGVKLWVPSLVWYLTDGTHHVVVDTGFPDPCAHETAMAGYSVRSTGSLKQILEQAACPVGAVEAIVFTHLHWDHCENLALFPGARLLVQREEMAYAIAPLDFDAESYNSPAAGRTPGWLGRRFSFLDGEAEILPGLEVLPTPGHTPGHQSVLVTTRGGTYGIAGDLLPTFANMHHPRSGGFHPPACLDYRSWWTSVQALARRCDTLLPSHDPTLEPTWIPAESS